MLENMQLINEMEEKLKHDPDNADLISEYALALIALGDYREALNQLEKAVKIKPSIQNQQNLAYFYFNAGAQWEDYFMPIMEKEAIEILEGIIQQNPPSYYPYNLLGEIYTSNGQYDRAIPLLKKAYRIEPTFENLNNLGVCFYNKSMFSEAGECFRMAFLTNNHHLSLFPIVSSGICMAKIGKKKDEVLLLAENLLLSEKIGESSEKLEDQIAVMYYLLDDFDKFVEIYSELDLFSYKVGCLPPYLYSLWKLGHFDKMNECFEAHINQLEIDIQDVLEDDDIDWQFASKEEQVEEIKADIQLLKTAMENISKGEKPDFLYKPEIARGCYVFGCKENDHPNHFQLEEEESGDTIQI